MFEITVNINAPDILKAAEMLADVLAGAKKQSAPCGGAFVTQKTEQTSTEEKKQNITAAESTIAIPTAVPTSPAPQITGDMIAKAGADLIVSNPAAMGPLNSMLQKYGISCAQELKPDQIGAFATEMRALGAKI